MTEKELLMQIMGLAYEITQLGKYEVNAEYSGLTNTISVLYVDAHWDEQREFKWLLMVVPVTKIDKLTDCISKLEEMLEESKS